MSDFSYSIPSNTLDWLLDSDPAVRWQIRSDLLESDNDEIHNDRLRIEIEGWGQTLLDYIPFNPDIPIISEQPKSNLFVWYVLRYLGLYPLEFLKESLVPIIDIGMKFNGGIAFSEAEEAHPCITGVLLSVLSYFRVNDPRRDAIIDYLIEHQKDDGSWDCPTEEHHTYMSTLRVLEGLRDNAMVNKPYNAIISDLQRSAHEYLLSEHLSLDGEPGDHLGFHDFSFPFLKYDIMTALDYFQSINLLYDERLKPAIDLLISKSTNFVWQLQPGPDFWIDFDVETITNHYNTLRGLRIIKWWQKISKEPIELVFG